MVLWTLVYKYLLEILVSVLLGIYPETELLYHWVVLCLIFWGTSILFSIAAIPFYISPSSTQEFQFFNVLANTCHFCFFFFNSSYPNGYVICVCLIPFIFSCKNFFLMFVYFWGGGAERERETQNLKQATGFELSAQSPMWGLNSRSMRSWPELKV